MSNLSTGSQNGRSFHLSAPDDSDGTGRVWTLYLNNINRGLVYAAHDREQSELQGIAIEYLMTGSHP
jgi:hypothetical protein